ncbi:MAG: Transcriptional regulatory protein MarR [Ilumatobacteraceae bacterium]|nr:Transcriptional regulatory protein MarR [Ilumatobacteraceae bacterium]
MEDVVDTVRRFNRAYTQRIGALDESFLGSGRPLGPSRLLFEIGLDGAAVLDLRARLGLDSGYLSRLLRRLETEGSVTVISDPADARRRLARLTAKGRREWRRLEQRSEATARSLVDPLSPRHRDRLREALQTAERLVRAASATFDVVDPMDPAARSALARYYAELDARFTTGFDAVAALSDGGAAMRAPTGTFVVVRSSGEPIACGGAQRHDRRSHEIKRMWVHPDFRGAGIGRRLLDDLEQRCTALGSRRVVLDTNSVLIEAIAMYERSGYTEIARYNDNPYAMRWFEKSLSRRR